MKTKTNRLRGVYYPMLRQRLTGSPGRGGNPERRPVPPAIDPQIPNGNYLIRYNLPGAEAPPMLPTPPPLGGHMGGQASFLVPTMTYNPNSQDTPLMMGKDGIGGMGIDVMHQMQQLSWMRQDRRRPGVVSPEAVLTSG